MVSNPIPPKINYPFQLLKEVTLGIIRETVSLPKVGEEILKGSINSIKPKYER